LRALYVQQQERPPLHAAVCAGDAALVERLIPTCLHAVDEVGDTAAHVAIKGHTAALRRLVRAGASLRHRNHTGYTLLTLACTMGATACLEELLSWAPVQTARRSLRPLSPTRPTLSGRWWCGAACPWTCPRACPRGAA
jgi:hypothetical protein